MTPIKISKSRILQYGGQTILTRSLAEIQKHINNKTDVFP